MANFTSLFKLAKGIENFVATGLINKDLLNISTLLKKYVGNDWKFAVEKFRRQCSFTDLNNYEKVLLRKIKISHNESYLIYLAKWQPHSYTKIHDHSENGCTFKILNGQLTETRYCSKTRNELYQLSATKNVTQYISNRWHLHKIENRTNNCAYSMHIYYEKQ